MDSERQLVTRSRAGDHAAFATLIARHQAVALRVAIAVVGSGGEADDVVQEAFIKSFTRLNQFEDGRSFQPWLLAIVANEARNRRRGAGRRQALTLRLSSPADASSTDAATDPALAQETTELRQSLAVAVASLSDRDREVVALRYFAELSEAEVAEALGCPVGTVKSRLSRALDRLRAATATEVLL